MKLFLVFFFIFPLDRMVVNYYHLTPPSEYQRRADYNNTYLAIYIIIDFYSITDLDCKVSPLLIFYECFFFFCPPVLFYLLYRFVVPQARARTFSSIDNNTVQDGVAAPPSYDYCRVETIFGISVSAIKCRRRRRCSSGKRVYYYYYYYYYYYRH